MDFFLNKSSKCITNMYANNALSFQVLLTGFN